MGSPSPASRRAPCGLEGLALPAGVLPGRTVCTRGLRPEPAVYLVVNARPLRDDGGNLRGAVIVLHDVTAQRQAHQALVESEQMAQAIVRTALDAFVQTGDRSLLSYITKPLRDQLNRSFREG